jgi:hypothetical protein
VKASFNALIAAIRTGLAAPFEAIAAHLQEFNGVAAGYFQNIANSIKPAVSATEVFKAGMRDAAQTIATAGAAVKDIWSSITADAKQAGASVDAMNALKTAIQQVDAEAAKGHLTGEEYAAAMSKVGAAAKAATVAGNDQAKVTQLA